MFVQYTGRVQYKGDIQYTGGYHEYSGGGGGGGCSSDRLDSWLGAGPPGL